MAALAGELFTRVQIRARPHRVGLGENAEDDSIVSHIVALARSLGIATLAEGVSERGQVERLLALGCELGQGVYFADAQPSSVIDRLIAKDASGEQPAPEPSESVEAGTVVLPSLRKANVGSETDQD